MPYRTSFTNCDFMVDKKLPKEFRGFISAWEVNGFQVRGCRFVNNSGLNTPYNYGIYGTCGVTIDGIFTRRDLLKNNPPTTPTEFRNLKDAVHIEQFGYTKAYASVANSRFYNCEVGVQSDAGLGAMVVRNNTFDLTKSNVAPRPFPIPLNVSTGALMQATTGFLINNNTFQNPKGAAPFTLYPVGVHVWNSGSTDNIVHNNVYEKLTSGSLGNFINRVASLDLKMAGLKFLCNENRSTLVDIAARGNDPMTNGIHPEQRKTGRGVSTAAGNVFSYEPPFQELAIVPGEVAPISYYYDPGGQNQTPVNYPTSTVNPIPADHAGCAVSGPVYSYPDEYGGDDDIDDDIIVKLPITPVPWPVNGNEVSPDDRSEAIAWFMADSAGMGSRDSLYNWLKLPGGNAYHDLLRTDLLVEDSAVSDALSLYNSIVATHNLTGQEATEFDLWGRKLLMLRIGMQQSGRNSWQVKIDEIDTLQRVAESGAMWAKVRAQSWLNMLNPELIFENEMLYPDCGDSTGAAFSKSAATPGADLPTVTQAQQQMLSISPNPTTGIVRIGIGNSAEMSVLDLSGRVVFSGALKPGIQEVSLAALPAGTYLYQVRDAKGATFTGKIVKQ